MAPPVAILNDSGYEPRARSSAPAVRPAGLPHAARGLSIVPSHEALLYDVCVFDFDGTVIDSMQAFADVAADVISARYGMVSDVARRRYLETSGAPFRLQLDMIFGADRAPVALEGGAVTLLQGGTARDFHDATAAEFESRKMRGVTAAHFFPEVRGLFETLRAAGVRTVISSNNFLVNCVRLVRAADLKVDMVLGYEPGFAKGAEHFDAIERWSGVGRDRMLFIGDSTKDAEWARTAGIDFVGRHGTLPAEAFTSRFPEFPVVADLRSLPGMVLTTTEGRA